VGLRYFLLLLATYPRTGRCSCGVMLLYLVVLFFDDRLFILLVS
jgi:hypothetical protein